MNTQIAMFIAEAGIMQPERFNSIDGTNQLEKLAMLIVNKCREIGIETDYIISSAEVYSVETKIANFFGIKED